MANPLPSRPNLDHLRRQAKVLLASLEAGDPEAAKTFIAHLPAAHGMTQAQVRAAGFRLADAQSAIARQSSFASWPQLTRHVETLRALEGSWSFARLEVGGMNVPAAAIQNSRIFIDGDRFRTESPEATYEGVFNIDVEAEPHLIDIEFIAGPEAGNWNYGIFRLIGDQLEICLDMNGKPAPMEFRAPAGSGHACELLDRVSTDRPQHVDGGKRPAPQPINDPTEFAYRPSTILTRLQGEWIAEQVVRDGMELPAMMLKTGSRSAKENEITIAFGGMVMIHALVRIDEAADPISVEYYNLDGPIKGTVQHGIMEWRGDSACFCMASTGAARPEAFSAPPGSGRTLSQWRPKQ